MHCLLRWSDRYDHHRADVDYIDHRSYHHDSSHHHNDSSAYDHDDGARSYDNQPTDQGQERVHYDYPYDHLHNGAQDHDDAAAHHDHKAAPDHDYRRPGNNGPANNRADDVEAAHQGSAPCDDDRPTDNCTAHHGAPDNGPTHDDNHSAQDACLYGRRRGEHARPCAGASLRGRRPDRLLGLEAPRGRLSEKYPYFQKLNRLGPAAGDSFLRRVRVTG